MKFIHYLLLILLLSGCRVDKKSDEFSCTQKHEICTCGAVKGKVNIRFLNNTNYRICNLQYMPDTTFSGYYSYLPANSYSCYVPYPYSFAYGFLSYDINEQTGTLNPIDFEGEPQLQAGNYTMVLKELGNGSPNKLYIDTLLAD